MDPEAFARAVELADNLGYILVASADEDGQPHVAAAQSVQATDQDHVTIESWFCPSTLENVDANPRVSLIAWDPTTDRGYQMTGTVENIVNKAVMDGYGPDIKLDTPLPQADYQLIVRVKEILEFTHEPHQDISL